MEERNQGAKDMIPTEVVLRIDARGMSLIEAEQICWTGDIRAILRALPNRLRHIDLECVTVEEPQA